MSRLPPLCPCPPGVTFLGTAYAGPPGPEPAFDRSLFLTAGGEVVAYDRPYRRPHDPSDTSGWLGPTPLDDAAGAVAGLDPLPGGLPEPLRSEVARRRLGLVAASLGMAQLAAGGPDALGPARAGAVLGVHEVFTELGEIADWLGVSPPGPPPALRGPNLTTATGLDLGDERVRLRRWVAATLEGLAGGGAGAGHTAARPRAVEGTSADRAGGGRPAAPPAAPGLSLFATGVAVISDQPDITVKELARRLGISRQRLYDDPELSALLGTLKRVKGHTSRPESVTPLRGFRTDDGGLEAIA